MYDPPCAFACRDAIAPHRLNCSTVEPKPRERRHGGHKPKFKTTPACFATDDSYLQSMAWCIQARCDDLETWAIDKFWGADVIWNQADHHETPRLGFHDALSQAGKAPNEEMEEHEVLTGAKLVPDKDWDRAFAMVRTFARVETSNSKYGIIVVLTAVLLPIFMTLLSSLASSTTLEAFVLTQLIHPPLWGQRHLVPLPLDVGLLPTRGQMAFISFQFLLNFALSIFGYSSVGSAWSVDNVRKLEFFANRVGILSFANLAVAILYATRNNPLVRLTGWSYSSFLLYHRRTAYLCVLQALLHSGIWLALHIHVLPKKFAQAYWTIGTLSMVAWCLIVPLSVLFVRRRYYEFFLNMHVLLASLSVAGCYYHIYFKFSHAYGYENWIYLASLIWVVERLARLAKLAKNGIRRAAITVIDDEYIAVTVPGVKATGYAYLYFPSLSWRVWENHPFSISVVMEGPEFRNLTKYEQLEILPRLHVLARSSPEDKRILVKRLKEQGEIVAVTGDGTNDAPALKTADVGFSMGIAGTEVAKEASAIILMDDNFNSIVKALMWGRAVNDAVKRFLQFQLTVNITAVVLTFVTSVSSNGGEGAVSVLTAVQLLWVNLIMDTLAALALATDPPQKSVLLRKPERRNASIISTTMWKMIIGQAIYQLAITFMLFYGYDHLDLVKNEMNLSPERFEAQVRTLVFNTFVWMQIFNQWNNRRLDNRFNIFEGLTQNYFFVAISSIMIGGQILIIFVGGAALSIAPDKQTALMWGIAIVLGFLSIPFGIVIRLIPDEFVERLIPDYLKRKSKESGPKLTVDDEEFGQYPEALADVRDELTFLKRMKGGRLNNLKFAVQHPRETFVTYSRSPTHSRSNSVINPAPPATPPRQASISEAPPAPTPESRRRSRSNRSRSNSALGAPTVMAGLIAAGVAANWTPNDPRRNRSDAGLAGESRDGISRQNSTSGHVSIQEEGHEVECPAAAKGQTESTSSTGGAQH
ncbi:Calcium-transporting ATPase 2 like protein [Verticillium longisporum]|nr:Calcium-transporting ATPase 2 like protein [Verticillium longisporum]